MWTDQLGNIPGYDDRKNGNGFGLGFYVLNDFNQYGAEGVFGWGGYHTTLFGSTRKTKCTPSTCAAVIRTIRRRLRNFARRYTRP